MHARASTFISHVHVYLGSSISLPEGNPLQVALESLLNHIVQRLLLHTGRDETAVCAWSAAKMSCMRVAAAVAGERTTSPGLQGSHSSVGYKRVTGQLRIPSP